MTAKSRIIKVCEVCGISYERRPCEANSRYCSKACWSHRNPPMQSTCAYCGNIFATTHRGARYCSRRCAGKDRTGPLAGAWKDGKSLERERARLSPQLKQWRIAVYTRDAHTCQNCGEGGRYINAHHIKPWADYPDLRFDVSNGITLCEDCHGKVHGKDFSNRRIKECPDCRKSIKGRGARCMSCAIRHWHAHRSALPLPPA